MPSTPCILASALVAAYLAAVPHAWAADSRGFPGRVVGVTDGDTVTVLDGNRNRIKIRVAGIDAPEKQQPFGEKSKRHLSDCAFGRDADVIGDKRDRYNRTVAKIIVDGNDCGLVQISAGLAWHYKKYEREQSAADRESYATAETAARDAKTGLWADKAPPVPPWEWRAAKAR
jgi:endonuclease YncB( thermonuclease family)